MNVSTLTSLIPESVQPVVYYVGLALIVILALYGLVTLLRRLSGRRSDTEERERESTAAQTDDAAIAAAIAASIVVTEDQALTAAITAAVAVYLEMENGGKSSLPTGFRVVSFKRRSGGAWNKASK